MRAPAPKRHKCKDAQQAQTMQEVLGACAHEDLILEGQNPENTPLSPEAHAAVLDALDDEYHAAAFYTAVLERFANAKPFTNIVEAEHRHAQALIAVLQHYGLPVPANSQMNSSEVHAQVPSHLKMACEMSIQAEIDNVKLYEEKLIPAVHGFNGVKAVFMRLMEASQQRHLPAFERWAVKYS